MEEDGFQCWISSYDITRDIAMQKSFARLLQTIDRLYIDILYKYIELKKKLFYKNCFGFLI